MKKARRHITSIAREGPGGKRLLHCKLECGHTVVRRIKHRRYGPSTGASREDPEPTWAYCKECGEG